MTKLWKGSTSSERACSTSIQRPHFAMQLSPLRLLALTNCGQTITCISISPSSPAHSRIKFVFIPARRALFCSLRRPQNKISSRMVIDTFFFRSTAMVPLPQKVIVMLENQISAVHPRLSKMDTISGIVDYTAIVADSTIAGAFLSCSCPSASCDTGRRELHSRSPNAQPTLRQSGDCVFRGRGLGQGLYHRCSPRGTSPPSSS